MAKVIKVKNPVLPNKEETYLTSKYTTGTALTVANNDGWADNDILVAGRPGKEQTEAGSVASTTGATTITLDAALDFDHSKNTPLFRSAYDQISLERKPSGGSFAEIAEGKVDIQWDERDGFTKISVAAGVDSDTYKWRYYNSKSTSYSAYSGELPGTGLTQQHAGFLIDSVRFFGKLPAFKGISDLDILNMLNRGQRQVDTYHDRWFFALTEDDSSSRVQAVANTYKYDLTSDFRGMDALFVLDTNSQKYKLKYRPLIAFDPLKTDDANTANHANDTRVWTLLPPDSSNTVGYFGVHPTPSDMTNYFYRRYWRFLPELTSFASKTLIPVPEVLINWALFELYKLREDRDNALFYFQQFQDGVGILKRLQRRQIGQAELMQWRGQQGFSNLFGELGVQNIDTLRENYW